MILAPPSSVTLPPLTAEVSSIAVTAVVETEGAESVSSGGAGSSELELHA
jgi:hypothetical protein